MRFQIEFDASREDEVRAICDDNLLLITQEGTVDDAGGAIGSGVTPPAPDFKAGKDL
jgi:hypothetical protein